MRFLGLLALFQIALVCASPAVAGNGVQRFVTPAPEVGVDAGCDCHSAAPQRFIQREYVAPAQVERVEVRTLRPPVRIIERVEVQRVVPSYSVQRFVTPRPRLGVSVFVR